MVNEETKPEEQDAPFTEEDIPSLLYYLVDVYTSLDSIDDKLIEDGDKIIKWKTKILGAIDYYINYLP
jgi:hypothetical protein